MLQSGCIITGRMAAGCGFNASEVLYNIAEMLLQLRDTDTLSIRDGPAHTSHTGRSIRLLVTCHVVVLSKAPTLQQQHQSGGC